MAPEDSGDPPSNDPTRDGSPASGEELFLANLELIDRVIRSVCYKNGLNPSDWDDFASHARLKLINNNYEVLRKFKGPRTGPSLPKYLHITITNMLRDYRNAVSGKWRASAEATRRGKTAILLEQLVWRDGHSFEEAFEMITVNHRITVTRGQLEQLYAALPEKAKRRMEPAEVLEGCPLRTLPTRGRSMRSACARSGASVWRSRSSSPRSPRRIG